MFFFFDCLVQYFPLSYYSSKAKFQNVAKEKPHYWRLYMQRLYMQKKKNPQKLMVEANITYIYFI